MRYRIGIDLGGTNIAAGLVDEEYRIVSKHSVPTKRQASESEIINEIGAMLENLLKLNGTSMKEVISIGIGVPGNANKETKEIEYANNLSFGKTAFAADLSKKLKREILFDNDANAAAWGEYLAGVGKGKAIQSLAAITIGTGIGGGLILNGEIYQGTNYAAAEFGHMVIEGNGIACNCGRRGCLEAYSSATALIKQTRKAMQKQTDSILWELCKYDLEKVEGKTLFEALEKKDALADAIFLEYIKYLGIGVVNIINLFQPDILCIGGGISNVGDRLLNPLIRIAKEQTYTRESKRQTQICIGALKNDAGIIGAAFLYN